MSNKPIFDVIRRLLKRGMTQAEVDAVNAALYETRITPDTPTVAEQAYRPRVVSREGVSLIHRYEGCARLRKDGLIEAYPDPGTNGDPWTIGWGSTGADRFNGGRIGPGTTWTQAQCDERFEEDLRRYAADVAAALGPSLENTSQEQFDALVSFHYNTGAIARATLTAKHRAGNHKGAFEEFSRWNRAGGRVMKGLVRRRADEADMYAKGMA